jgi:F-type H+-transporting ATPase subunit b
VEAFSELLSLPVVISSLAGFLVLFFFLRKFLWRAVLNVIDERRASIEQAFAEVDQARDDVARMKADYEAQLSRISDEAQAKLQEAVAQGQQVAADIRAAAEEVRERMIQKAQEDIGREKEKALAEIRNAAVDLSFAISERVLRQSLDRPAHDQLVSSFIDELKAIETKERR